MGEHLVIPVECRASASGPRLHGVLLSEGRAASGGRSELFVPGSIVWPAEGIGIGLQHLGAVETRAVPTRVGNEIRVEAEATPKLFAAVQAGARYMSLEFHPLFRVVGDPPAAGRLRSTGITPPQHYYTPLRHPLAFGSLPGVAGYRAYLARRRRPIRRTLKSGMTQRKIEYWVIPPQADAEFVAHMEQVLDTYAQPYDPACPVVCNG